MATFELHITGIVQGVGFRPFVFNLANKLGLEGTVANRTDGVFIRFNTCDTCADTFKDAILAGKPAKASITSVSLKRISDQTFDGFRIVHSGETAGSGSLLITPDYAICPECLEEFEQSGNRRNGYAFITCTDCGPRLSITRQLPFDRENTTMVPFDMCPDCLREYNDPNDRRFYSQTNSCPTCGISLSVFTGDGKQQTGVDDPLAFCTRKLREGKIVAVKGIGGYLLMADATNPDTIRLLRHKKQRPHKPFALMMSSEKMLEKYVAVTPLRIERWQDDSAPIVLFDALPENDLPIDLLAPGLGELGIMRPYTALHYQLCRDAGIPLIATSGNLSGSPIIYKDEDALKHLGSIADYLLVHNREIVVPQDDSVVRFTETERAIIIRRSRGLAPNTSCKAGYPTNTFAAGAMLKSAFALSNDQNIFVSQYLGATNSLETQDAYRSVFGHLKALLRVQPETVLADLHPGYFTTEFAESLAASENIPLEKIQHHKAHLCAVIGEHNSFDRNVLGFVWDGTGLGEDSHIWGGEIFEYANGTINRLLHLPAFRHILGDKMVREPRLSALSIFDGIDGADDLLKQKFSDTEYDFYRNQLEKSTLLSTSAGRLFDAVASILGLIDVTTYHGQAAMLIEALALSDPNWPDRPAYPVSVTPSGIDISEMKQAIVNSLLAGTDKRSIASRFHQSLIAIIEKVANLYPDHMLAYSGGVFQNRMLIDLIVYKLFSREHLFHKLLSPNDECIAFGQMMHKEHIKPRN